MPTRYSVEAGSTADAPLRVHHLIERAADAHGQRAAVVFGNRQLTYRELNQQADRLSRAILHHAPDADLIGVSASRSIEMVVGVLAILKAGKAYLPLDPTYPAQRLQQLIADSGVTVCLATGTDLPTFEPLGLRMILSEKEYAYPPQPVSQQNPTACVLYTSGSTGNPKGVCLGHAGLMNLLNWQLTHSEAGIGLNTLQFCHLSFDASFQEIFVTLLSGGTLHLIDDAYRLDAGRLLQFIDTTPIHRVFLPYVVLQYVAETADAEQRYPAGLREVITGGELLKITPQIARFFAQLPDCTLMNVYGPTEASVWVTEHKLKGDALTWPAIPTIGKPIAGIDVFMVDENGQLSADGVVGEVCISGICLASGYLNQPALTAEKFSPYCHPQRGRVNLYRTGDLARYLPDGTIEFWGRKDDQVKIRGNRVEPGEIEVALARHPGVKQAVVVAREDGVGSKALLAYVVATRETAMATVRAALEQQLPDFMIPAYFVRLDDLPKTSSGKVDRKALPDPERKRPDSVPYRRAGSQVEGAVVGVWRALLGVERIGIDDNFFELGGNSLLAQKTVSRLKQAYNYEVGVTKIYQFPTVSGLADYLDSRKKPLVQSRKPHRLTRSLGDVAIIGMAGRFPGANTIDELWAVLKAGKETIHFFTENELDPSLPADVTTDPAYVKARGIIDQADQFDAAFFGLNAKLAEVMDPQQRIFMEIAWEVLEKAGYLPQQNAGRIGVWAGCGNNTYYLNNVLRNQPVVNQVGSFQAMTVNEKDYIASRTAYQLDLKGPAVSVYSACSSSLLAVTQAVESLRTGTCELAIAGGASITAPVYSGHLYEEGAMLSRDGHCRPFDADAQGTVFSDGAGVVLLKSLEAAKQDGDTIYAVIKGVGVNNDGGGKGSFTAPNAEGQAGAIRMALNDAQVDPSTISYVEAHGTATPLGDPVEIDGLKIAFGESPRKGVCALGSIKSNMGHLTAAAGVAGLIKTTLALHNRQIPPSIGFSTLNPAIDFSDSPFFVNSALAEWESDGLRRAGVSSFGVGGTNVHVVVEEWAGRALAPDRLPRAKSRPIQLVTWSAKSIPSLDAYATRLADHLRQQPPQSVADVAFTLQTTRVPFAHRRFVVAATEGELTDALLTPTLLSANDGTGTLLEAPSETVFVFPGQGSQYLNMGCELYENETVYQQAVDECANILTTHLDTDIRQVLYPNSNDSAAKDRLKNTQYTQPALFVTEYALAKLWMSWGIEPTIFCGHSLGEFVAAHLAGVFTLTDALTLVAARGRMISSLPRGSMLSVRLEAEKVNELLPKTVSMAAVNSRKQCVVAGTDEDIAAVARLLDSREIANQVLETSHAFHSVMMDPIIDEFKELVQRVSLNRPQKPIVSTVSGTWLTDAQATDPQYWATHMRATVRFADALETLFELPKPLLLEVGPGSVTTILARQQMAPRSIDAVVSLTNRDGQTEYQSVLKALGQLWVKGVEPDWKAFYAGQNRRKALLPTYAFDRKRCWVDPVSGLPQTKSIPVIQPTIEKAVDTHHNNTVMRRNGILDTVRAVLNETAGIETEGVSPTSSFLELGLDSLALTQLSLNFRKKFELPLSFRQLNGEYGTLEKLVDYLDHNLPADAYQPPAPEIHSLPPVVVPVATQVVVTGATALPAGNGSIMELFAQQLQILAQQLAVLQGAAPALTPPAVQPAATGSGPESTVSKAPVVMPGTKAAPFGAIARIERQATELTTGQKQFLQRLTERYNHKTAGSKAYAQEHRRWMADPRVVSGFKPLTKELVYPIVVDKSKGSRLWDIDGNEYIDVLNGFGSTMFGYQPDMLKTALHEQVEKGYEIGPQHKMAGEVCRLICEFTGFDRAALCNTGSEAVMGAMRIARTVTGRSLIVSFSGSYHGIFDEVIVRGAPNLKSYPAASGIMPESVQNMLILEYGTEQSLQIIRERAHELAAVLVEPVQSRRPEFQPVDFLRKVRKVTESSGTTLIFDEVITGFRMHPGGAQALFGIKADLATYGKVLGGGLPIGVIAGKETFMDALDGGFWQYGDASCPEADVTYFAGTFVRHPLALAATKASLLYMKDKGPNLQKSLTAKAELLADTLNLAFERQQLPLFVAQFGSLWKIKFKEEVPYGELLFTIMREKGIHVWDGFPCFMTEAHTEEEIKLIATLFIASSSELIDAGFLTRSHSSTEKIMTALINNSQPPVPGAKLGRDQKGNPAWFVPDSNLPEGYLQIDLNQAPNQESFISQ